MLIPSSDRETDLGWEGEVNCKHDAAGHGHKHEKGLGLKFSVLCLVTLPSCCYKVHFTVAWIFIFLTLITASQVNCPAPSATFSLELGWVSVSQHCSWSCCAPRLCPRLQDTGTWLCRDQQPVYLGLKILCIWPILFSSRAVLLLAVSAQSICAASEEWQSCSALARLDHVLLNWVHQTVRGAQSLQGRHIIKWSVYIRELHLEQNSYSAGYQSWLLCS